MFRGFSSLLGLFFVTAGVFAVASLSKNPVAVLPPPSGGPVSSDRPQARFLAVEAPVFHARFSLN